MRARSRRASALFRMYANVTNYSWRWCARGEFEQECLLGCVWECVPIDTHTHGISRHISTERLLLLLLVLLLWCCWLSSTTVCCLFVRMSVLIIYTFPVSEPLLSDICKQPLRVNITEKRAPGQGWREIESNWIFKQPMGDDGWYILHYSLYDVWIYLWIFVTIVLVLKAIPIYKNMLLCCWKSLAFARVLILCSYRRTKTSLELFFMFRVNDFFIHTSMIS